MPSVQIEDKGCRGCTLCVDICPVDVFEQKDDMATVKTEADCIGCLSCFYLCPSQCIAVGDVEMLRPFHRIEHNVALVEKFLQEKAVSNEMTATDYEEAHADVARRLHALAEAVVECMGRGQKAVGRKAGGVAAEHLPEMYEESTLEDVLKRMQERFRHAFDFEYEINGEEIDLTFHCGLHKVVTDAGESVGDAVLCHLFHEYWAGLLGQFTKSRYRYKMPQVGETCKMKLTPP